MYKNANGEYVLTHAEMAGFALALNHSAKYLMSQNCKTLALINKEKADKIWALIEKDKKES